MHFELDPTLARLGAGDDFAGGLAAFVARFWPLLMIAVIGLMLCLRHAVI